MSLLCASLALLHTRLFMRVAGLAVHAHLLHVLSRHALLCALLAPSSSLQQLGIGKE
jgi:nitrate reductase gamma subunit